MIGGDKKKAGAAKEQGEGGIGGMLSGAVGKAATDAAGNKAAEQALAFGKGLLK
ncbi:hypothetical protein F2P79_021486 [Pimephales promelas]|nr:hypothetical protein F2P79_021486 [Pimephales promelas]KAG1931913.1 hypothetical protein F2P79_021486 [Pimephales promelas]